MEERVEPRRADLQAEIRLVGREEPDPTARRDVDRLRAALRLHRQRPVAGPLHPRIEGAERFAPQREPGSEEARLEAGPRARALHHDLARERAPPSEVGGGRRQQLAQIEGRSLRRAVVDAVVAEAAMEAHGAASDARPPGSDLGRSSGEDRMHVEVGERHAVIASLRGGDVDGAFGCAAPALHVRLSRDEPLDLHVPRQRAGEVLGRPVAHPHREIEAVVLAVVTGPGRAVEPELAAAALEHERV